MVASIFFLNEVKGRADGLGREAHQPIDLKTAASGSLSFCPVGARAGKKIALDDEKYRPYSTNEAIIIGIQNQDSICVNLGLYTIRKIIGFSSELVVSVFRDPIILY